MPTFTRPMVVRHYKLSLIEGAYTYPFYSSLSLYLGLTVKILQYEVNIAN